MALGNFELDIQKFVDKAKGNTTLVVRKIALDLFKRVIQKSPVDTGRFKSNWQVSINSIPAGTIGLAEDISHTRGGRERKRGAEARGTFAGNFALAKATTTALQFKTGEVIYLVNNLEYARALEYGHSKQAPAGMVRLTLAEFPQVVAKAANEVPK